MVAIVVVAAVILVVVVVMVVILVVVVVIIFKYEEIVDCIGNTSNTSYVLAWISELFSLFKRYHCVGHV